MRNHTVSVAVVAAITTATLSACTTSGSDGQDMSDTPVMSQAPAREVIPVKLGEEITIDGGQGPLVTFSLTDISRTDTCGSRGDTETPVEGEFLAVDYQLEAGQTPPATGLKFTTLDEEGFSQEMGPESFCNDGPSINQFRTAEKIRGTYYFDVQPDAAQLKAEPRFGNVLNENLPAGWAWQIPS